MEYHLRFLLLLLTVCTSCSNIVQILYKRLEPGQNITAGAQVTTRSKIQCSSRCSSQSECRPYQYTGSRPAKCILIHRNSTAENGVTFSSEDLNSIYKKECSLSCQNGAEGFMSACIPSYTWTSPAEWTGPHPVVYRSFDNLDCMTKMEGKEQADFPFIGGKRKGAVSLDHTRRQWVDLGVLVEACITRPETCGVAGAAVALWMRIEYPDSSDYRGVVSSVSSNSQASFIFAKRYALSVLDGYFSTSPISLPSEWTHVVMNYVGPEEGQGIQIYVNGTLRESTVTKVSETFHSGDGRVVIGRYLTDGHGDYANVDVDELLFFNEKLSDQQIEDIRNGD